MDKEDVVYMHNGILFSHEKGHLKLLAAYMEGLEGIMLREISQRQIMYISLTYMPSKKVKWIETY